jgi:anti-sigma factor RsiW
MTEAEKQLLTAYLDGVLSAAEKERAELLLRTSVEARQLFSDLVSDSLRLKYLRREQLPTDFADRVVAILREEVARLARRQLWRLRIRRWAPVAVAAALLPFIAWGTFALLSQILTRPESPSVAFIEPVAAATARF